MSMQRPIAHAEVVDVVTKVLGQAPEQLVRLKGGPGGKEFSFDTQDGKRIIRFRDKPAKFFRDIYAWRHFKSPTLPIPQVFYVGEFADKARFCISEFLPGSPLKFVDEKGNRVNRELALGMARELHEHVAATAAAGHWDKNGQGQFPSWRRYLQHTAEKAVWHGPTEGSDDGAIFERLITLHKGLIGACPDLHSVIHGSFGSTNVLVHEGRLSGVLNWQNSLYGDFLFDLARLDFWHPNANLLSNLERFYQPPVWPLDRLEERVRCYQLWLAAQALKSTASENLPKRRNFILGRIQNWL